MAKKAAFLLLELLVAMTTFLIFVSAFSYFIYISVQTKKIALACLDQLNNAVDELEKIKIKKTDLTAKHFNIKISQKSGNFSFVVVEKEFQSLIKNVQKIILIGAIK